MYVCRKIISNDGQVKSFVDDLSTERGTVSMRVAFVLRSAEVQPLFLRFVQVDVLTDVLAISPPQSTPPIFDLAVCGDAPTCPDQDNLGHTPPIAKSRV